MSQTRTASYDNSRDPAHAPERHLSSARLRGINVSLAIVAQAARAYPKPIREACLWLANLAANSQRIQTCWQRRSGPDGRNLPDPLGTVGRITEADLATKLGLHPHDIYDVLTCGGEANLETFRAAVQKFRDEFERALPPLVKTRDTATIEEAFAAAGDEHDICALEGKWRHGKTEETERRWLLNLHRAVWIHTPEDKTQKSFLFALAGALGIGVSAQKKPVQLREQILRALGVGLIDTLIFDEAHKLWPDDIADSNPQRIEFVRTIKDQLCVGSVLIVTDQFALNLELARQTNTRWAPGQFFGRRRRYTLRDTHTDAEIKAIAKLHAGGALEDDALALFLAFARAEEGYLGAMTNAIKQARRAAKDGAITAAHAAEATRLQQHDARIIELAKAATPKRRGLKLAAVAVSRRAA